jgi:hypothetical protein
MLLCESICSQSISFLQGMKPEHLAILTECAMLAEFKKDELISRQGDPAN